MSAPRFRGWITLGPRQRIREGDRYSYSPECYTSPAKMFTVKGNAFLKAGVTVAEGRKARSSFECKEAHLTSAGWVFRRRPVKKRKACSYAKKYKAKRKPTCGCSSCADKWRAHQRRLRQASGQLVTQGGKIQLLRVALP
jgi:hypothetical protein